MTQPGQRATPSAPDEAPLTLLTLGAVHLSGPVPHGDGATPIGLPPGKSLALLTYLHCLPGRSASREHLLGQFWSDSSPEAGRQALRQTVYRIRSELGAEAVVSTGERLTLTLPLQCDRNTFLDAVRQGRDQDAVRSYGGEFFPSYAAPGATGFEQWADVERDSLRAAFLRAAEGAVRQGMASGAAADALAAAQKARALCPSSELAWRLLLDALTSTGHHAAALLEADALLALLKLEEREPEPATIRQIGRIRGTPAPDGAPSGVRPDPLAVELVGREQEFALLTSAWRACQGGGRRYIHLHGPSGIGKSRLLAELGIRIRIAPAHLIELRSSPPDRFRKWALLGDLVTALGRCGGARGAAPESLALLTSVAPTLSSLVEPANRPRPTQLLPTAAVQATADLLEAVADDRPLAVLLDDLHWADAESLDVIAGVLVRTKSARVLVVTSSREGPAVLGAGTLEGLSVGPLEAAAITALLGHLGTDVEDPATATLAASLRQSSGGNPLLILTLLRLLLDQRLVTIDQSGWSWKDLGAALRVASTTNPLDIRLANLGPDARGLLLLVALADRPVPVARAVEQARATPGVVERLEQAGLVRVTGEQVTVSHDAVAEAVRHGASDEEMRRVHDQLGHLFRELVGSVPVAYWQAAGHFRAARNGQALGRLFYSRLRESRRQESPLSPRELARQTLGPTATPEEIAALLRYAPLSARLLPTRRHRTAAALGGALLLATILAATTLRETPVPPDAVLMLAMREDSTVPRVSLFEVPIRRDQPPQAVIPASRWKKVGTLPSGIEPYSRFMVAPDDRRMVLDVYYGDSGGVDLALRDRRGRVTRLTDAPGDDFAPSWAPDGSAVAFATSRWTPAGDTDSDIAVLHLDTGVILPLTAGPSYDDHPHWSPDGTRIAFTRRTSGRRPHTACWVTSDRHRTQCHEMPGGGFARVAGWSGDSALVIVSRDPADEFGLWRLVLSTGYSVPEVPGRYLGDAVIQHPWVACACGSSRDEIAISRLGAEPDLGRLAVSHRPWHPSMTWKPAAAELDLGITRVQIEPRDRPILQGIEHWFALAALGADGSPRRLSEGLVRWESRDTAIAVIDPERGVLTGRSAGATWIVAGAGGWRTDSVEVVVGSFPARLLLTEDWSDTSLAGWWRQGTPVPIVTVGPNGIPGLMNNGDHEFDSGALGRDAFYGDSGLAVDALIHAPIHDLKWQSLRLGLSESASWIRSGFSGSPACQLSIPLAEGAPLPADLTLAGAGTKVTLRSSVPIARDDWVRVRIQRFPDGSCGLAVNGIAVARLAAGSERAQGMSVFLHGQSVRTRMLVGPLTIWHGIPSGVDWARVGRPRQDSEPLELDPKVLDPPTP